MPDNFTDWMKLIGLIAFAIMGLFTGFWIGWAVILLFFWIVGYFVDDK